MAKKSGWTDEQRQAAAQRMQARWDAKRQSHQTPFGDNPAREPEIPVGAGRMRQGAPVAVAEGQNVGILEKVQTETITKEQADPDVHRQIIEASGPIVSEAVVPPTRIGSREVSLVVRTDGTMVSQYGPCLCGKSKREWHTICLKEAK